MKKVFTAAPGSDIVYASLPNGTPIRGIVVDNPSGSWLYISSEQQWVPPYTNGWSMPLTYDQTAITVDAQNQGPAGQVSTTQGSNWSLTLDSEPTDVNSGGPTSQFIDQFTPQIKVSSTGVVPLSTGLTISPLVAGVANKRIRIWSLETAQIFVTGEFEGVLTAGWVDDGTTPYVIHSGISNFQMPTSVVTYPRGFDLEIGSPLKLALFGTVTDKTARYSATYSLI
jgi:hypothetical protein